jgi:tetratricopeptide (TPR) repeat protein
MQLAFKKSFSQVFVMCETKSMKGILALCLMFWCGADYYAAAQAQKKKNRSAATTGKSVTKNAQTQSASSDPSNSDQNEINASLELAPSERIEKLKAILASPETSATAKVRASELIVSAHAARGDELLKAGDAQGGAEQFRLAITEAPDKISDKLFAGVISQLPFNLFARGERAAAVEVARLIEEKVKDDPARLLNLAGFYARIEDAEDAARLAQAAIKLAPDMAVAYQALGVAQRIALQTEAAAVSYARALELDPKSAGARRSLADLRRALGQPNEALVLYREALKADPNDRAARSGMILALLDAGQREEAERELDSVLQTDERNVLLLTGAAYWYVAHDARSARALELAGRAVEIEPRYTWAQIALACALVAQKRPLDAERALSFARQYGRFPTLDYEVANALAAAGLYEEAADALARSFRIKDGALETDLAGRVSSRAANFIELLAPERLAAIFQPAAADTEVNARVLKGLLALNLALRDDNADAVAKEKNALAAAQDFTAGDDPMRTFRQLYVARRLLQSGLALSEVVELSDAAAGGVEAALDVPTAPVATFADEMRTLRAQAEASGEPPPTVLDFQRNVLANVLRGRIEDTAGWALFKQERASQAVPRLKRAVSVLPENTDLWRAALWHLGAALDANGNSEEALAAYLKSYKSGAPDAARRALIEAIYRKVNGSLKGLDEKLGPAP